MKPSDGVLASRRRKWHRHNPSGNAKHERQQKESKPVSLFETLCHELRESKHGHKIQIRAVFCHTG